MISTAPVRSAATGRSAGARRAATGTRELSATQRRRVLVVAYDGGELLDIACVTSALQGANRVAGRELYGAEVVSLGGRDVVCAGGAVIRAAGSVQRAVGAVDTLVVSGGDGHELAAADPSLVAHVRRLALDSRRVASVCTGATVLAAAGLLDGRRATTHWAYADQLARNYPGVCVDPSPIYVRDGRVSTSAGVTSGLDLTLSFIAEDHGESLARDVARSMVAYLHRPGEQAQLSMFVAPDHDHQLVERAVQHIAGNMSDSLDTATLGRKFGVSERHLNRLFVADTGLTPGRYVRRVRTEAAARLLTTTDLRVSDVARKCGFGTSEALRQAFAQHYDVSPARYRRVMTVRRGTA